MSLPLTFIIDSRLRMATLAPVDEIAGEAVFCSSFSFAESATLKRRRAATLEVEITGEADKLLLALRDSEELFDGTMDFFFGIAEEFVIDGIEDEDVDEEIPVVEIDDDERVRILFGADGGNLPSFDAPVDAADADADVADVRDLGPREAGRIAEVDIEN